MSVFTSLSALEAAIKQAAAEALAATVTKSKDDLDLYLTRYYGAPEGIYYRPRTHTLEKQGRIDYLTDEEGQISVNTGYSYPRQGISTESIVTMAETGEGNLLGVPHFWQDTMSKVEEHMIEEFGKQFSKK